jgi:hypothetical protein
VSGKERMQIISISSMNCERHVYGGGIALFGLQLPSFSPPAAMDQFFSTLVLDWRVSHYKRSTFYGRVREM